MCKSIFSTTCLPGPNSISATHFATKLGRQGCRRKTKTRHPNDRLDHNNFNHNSTIDNSLHDIQKVSLCILLTKGMLPLVSIQHDHNNFNHNSTIDNSLHDIQKVSLCILLTKGMLPLVSIQHDTLRHHAHGYFRRSGKFGFGGSHVGAFHIRHSTPIAIKDHRLSLRLRHAHYKTLLLQTAAD